MSKYRGSLIICPEILMVYGLNTAKIKLAIPATEELKIALPNKYIINSHNSEQVRLKIRHPDSIFTPQ